MPEMIFLNPQWQGSGNLPAIEQGARVLSGFMNKTGVVEVPLSPLPLDTARGIMAYHPICEQLESFRLLVEKGSPEKISTIGGDCGIELIPVSYLNKKYDHELTVIWFDGHTDLNSVKTSPSQHFHGMPVRVLLGEGEDGILKKSFSVLYPEQFVFVGINDMDPAEEEFVNEFKMALVKSPDQALIHQIVAGKSSRNIYIHFDLDVLTEKEFPHTPYPNKTGFSVADAVKIIRELKKDFNVVGSSVTESIADTIEKLRPIEKLLEELIP
jgi:arginase